MAVLTAEAVCVATVFVAGAIGGLAVMRDATNDAATDVSEAIQSLDPSYQFCGNRNACSQTAGSGYTASRIELWEYETDAQGNVVEGSKRVYVLREPPFRGARSWRGSPEAAGGSPARTRVLRRYRPAAVEPKSLEPTSSVVD